MNRMLNAYTLLVITIILLQASGIQSSPSITITDALGRTVTIEKTPARIVSLAPSITELLFYLGLGDRIVGMDSYSIKDPYYNISETGAVRNVTDVGGYWWSAISMDKILSLKPDLVIADKGAHKPLLQAFTDYNLTVVYLNGGSARSIQDIYQDVGIISQIFNTSDKAREFIEQVESSLNTYRGKLSPYSNYTILVVVGIYNGIWVAGKSTYIDDVLSRLGLRNAAETIGWKAVSLEEIASWNPGIILISGDLDNQSVVQAGLYSLGSKIIILDRETTDALSRPGPLLIRLPALLYQTLVENIPTVKGGAIHGQASPTQPLNNTSTSSLRRTETPLSTTTPASRGYSLGEGTVVLTSTLIAFLIGLAIGYIIYKKIG